MTELEHPPTGRARRHRPWAWGGAVLVVAVVAFVLFWFQPQKLFIDDRVVEELPTPTQGPDDEDATPPEAATTAPTEIVGGAFISLDHGTTGRARVLQLADGTRIVRLDGLDTSNGPDLYLYLAASPADGDERAFDDDFVSLGRLKGNQGDQNYELPAGVDLARYRTVVVWCDRFDSAFGAADLT